MFLHNRPFLQLFARREAAPLPPLRARLILTIGNLLFFAGIYVLLYVGGVQSQIAYHRLAARGDNDLVAHPVVIAAPSSSENNARSEPAVFSVPVIGEVTAPLSADDSTSAAPATTVNRLVIPSIDVDSKVVEVGWRIEDIAGQETAIWDVAEFAVGQHRGSANPGQGGNIVLAGHVGGYGKVFRDLYYVNPGDQIIVYSQGQQYLYLVEERILVTEEGVSAEQRAANARYIAPTDHEVVTMVTCWPISGPDRFSQRIIVRAVPFDSNAPATGGPTRWNIR